MNKPILSIQDYSDALYYPHNNFLKKRAIERLKKWKIIPLYENDYRLSFLSFITGWLIGDGTLNERCMCFFDDNSISLQLLKNEFENKFPQISINGPNIEIKKNGTSHTLVVNDYSLARLMLFLRIPSNKKTEKSFTIPSFITINKDTKRAFLGGLLGSEMHTPVLDPTRNCSVRSLFFGMSKNPSFEIPHTNFLSSVKEILEEFNIKTGKFYKYIPKRSNEYPVYGFYIRKNIENVLRLYIEIPFVFFFNKNRKFEETIKKIIENYKDKEDVVNNYYKILELSKQGFSTRKISKIIKQPKTTVWQWTKRQSNYLRRIERIQPLIQKCLTRRRQIYPFYFSKKIFKNK